MPSLNRTIEVDIKTAEGSSIPVLGITGLDDGEIGIRDPTRVNAEAIGILGDDLTAALDVTRPKNIRVGSTSIYCDVLGPGQETVHAHTGRVVGFYNDRLHDLIGTWPAGTAISIGGHRWVTSAIKDWSVRAYRNPFPGFDVIAIPIVAATKSLSVASANQPSNLFVRARNVIYPAAPARVVKYWAALQDEQSEEQVIETGAIVVVTTCTFVVRYDESLFNESNVDSMLTDDDGLTWEIIGLDRMGFRDMVGIRCKRLQRQLT